MTTDRDSIIEEIQRIARKKNVKKLTWSEFSVESGISRWQIYQEFEGWREACELAGLEANYQNIPIKDKDLFEEMSRVFLDFDGICTRTKFDKLSKYSVDTYKKRFGNWHQILIVFRRWLEQKEIDFPFIEELPTDTISDVTVTQQPQEQNMPELQQWQNMGGTTYGPFLNFRGLQHAPLNEQGLIFLFGMVCHELGFVVEAVRPDYPDCEAKRLVDKKQDKWERVRIEFEFKSSSFKVHGHKPDLCDVIICWEHDWPDCPLEVIELKSVIESLSS